MLKLIELLFLSIIAKDNEDGEGKSKNEEGEGKSKNEEGEGKKSSENDKGSLEHLKKLPVERINDIMKQNAKYKAENLKFLEAESNRETERLKKEQDWKELEKKIANDYKELQNKQIEEIKDELFSSSELPEKIRKMITGNSIKEIKESIEAFKELSGKSRLGKKEDGERKTDPKVNSLLKAFLG